MDGEADSRFYRYSVKCDREQNQDIERRAKKAGMSPTTYVQQHFETIFFEQAEPAAPVEEADKRPALPSDIPAAPAHDDADFDDWQPTLVATKTKDRVLEAVKKHSRNGLTKISYRDLGAEVGASQETVRHHVENLVKRGTLLIETPGSRGNAATYRIPNLEPNDA